MVPGEYLPRGKRESFAPRPVVRLGVAIVFGSILLWVLFVGLSRGWARGIGPRLFINSSESG